LEGAPLIYGFESPTDFTAGALHKVLEGKKVGCPTCVVSFAWYLIAIQHLDLAGLSKTVVSKLTASGENIAFNGLSSGEALITTVPKTGSDDASSYYQVLLVTQYCDSVVDLGPDKMTCGIVGSAEIVTISKDKVHESSKTDKLCQEIERLFGDYFYSVVSACAPYKK